MQLQQHPRLPEKRFLSLVYATKDAEVLFIAGMRDEGSQPFRIWCQTVDLSRFASKVAKRHDWLAQGATGIVTAVSGLIARCIQLKHFSRTQL
jgi:hypothetical protein